jgi:hypothetical protein
MIRTDVALILRRIRIELSTIRCSGLAHRRDHVIVRDHPDDSVYVRDTLGDYAMPLIAHHTRDCVNGAGHHTRDVRTVLGRVQGSTLRFDRACARPSGLDAASAQRTDWPLRDDPRV